MNLVDRILRNISIRGLLAAAHAAARAKRAVQPFWSATTAGVLPPSSRNP